MNTSFTRKIIETRITLAKGSFGGQGNTKVIRGLATEVSVEKPGLPDKGKASIKITNVPLNDMEQLTTLAFKPLQYQRNSVVVLAGDAESGLSQVFSGEITSAFGNFNAAPDPVFEIEAMTGFFGALIPQQPTSTAGNVGVADIVGQMAAKMGYSFKNEGVSAQLRNSVFNGSPLEQAQAAARQSGVELLVDDGAMVLLPAGSARAGNAVLLNKNSGMIGYPAFNNNGITVKCLYNPAIRFGGLIRVESIVPKASGVWRITKLSHKLSAFHTGGGNWVSEIEGTYRMGM
ncbi:MAG: hypothetical protein RRY29_03875 [Desulfovibrionaceae bacterium]